MPALGQSSKPINSIPIVQVCMAGKSVLFSTEVDAINTLAAAQAASRIKAEIKKYPAPRS
jgi:hypothetical protein